MADAHKEAALGGLGCSSHSLVEGLDLYSCGTWSAFDLLHVLLFDGLSVPIQNTPLGSVTAKIPGPSPHGLLKVNSTASASFRLWNPSMCVTLGHKDVHPRAECEPRAGGHGEETREHRERSQMLARCCCAPGPPARNSESRCLSAACCKLRAAPRALGPRPGSCRPLRDPGAKGWREKRLP